MDGEKKFCEIKRNREINFNLIEKIKFNFP